MSVKSLQYRKQFLTRSKRKAQAMNGPNGQQQPQVLTVEFDPRVDIIIKAMPGTNNIRVAGPIDNKIYALGMLALAEQAIHKFDPSAAVEAKSKVVEAPASALQGLPDPDFQTRR